MISMEFDNNSSKSLYVQLYEYLRREIAEGRIGTGERLPSLRTMSEEAGMSVTTVKTAYEQLMVEGYLTSKPQSGYYAARGAVIKDSHKRPKGHDREEVADVKAQESNAEAQKSGALPLNCDLDSFDFVKWKKCMSTVLNETPELLLSEADRQGEPALREEIARYLYKSRGVICTQEQVVISAGTQQLINHLARILKMMDIEHVSVEDPGYMPVRSIFRDWGFSMNSIPVKGDVFKYIAGCNTKFDFIFADPPYQLENLAQIPDLVLDNGLLAPDGIFVLEHGSKNDFSNHPRFTDMKVYGSVHFSFFR